MPSWPTMTTAVADLTVRYARTGGDKPPALLLHGLMGSGATWTPVARALENEFDVILPDARGHGGSSAPAVGYRYGDLADDTVGLIDNLALSRPVLIGHSMGGMTAALVASRIGQRLRGLVLADPTFLTSERQQEVFESDVLGQHTQAVARGRAALLEEALSRPTRRAAELVELQVEARLKMSPAAIDILRPPNPPYRELVSTIAVPTLLVVGDKTIVTFDMAAELRDRNPNVRIARVDNAGHGLPFDHPTQLAQSILDFFRVCRSCTGHAPRDDLDVGAAPGACSEP